MEKFETKLDVLSDRLADLNITLVRNTVALEEHIRRTDLLETQVKENKAAVQPTVDRVVAAWSFLQVSSWVLTGVGALLGVLRLLGKL